MADNLTLALKIKADLKNTLTDFKTLERELQRTGAASAQLGQKSAKSAKELDNLGHSADVTNNKLGKTRAGVESISKQLQRLQNLSVTAFVGKHISNAIGGLAQTADDFNSYEARIRLISKSNQAAEGTFRNLMQVANDTGQLFGTTADLYTRVYRAMGNQANSTELLQFTKTINQSMVVSGASAQEASSALVQLSQALASGTLRGDEFNSVSEQAPVILEMLQKHLGKTRGELRKMAEEGQLTTDIIMTAVKGAADEIQTQYDQMPKTIGRAVNELTNAWMQFVGQTDNMISASSFVATTISVLAKNLNLLAGAALAVGAVIGVRLIAAYGVQLAMMARMTAMTIFANRTLTARATIEAKAAQASLAMARSTDAEAAATARLTAANKALAVARAGAVAKAGGLGGVGGGLMAMMGGAWGVAITAVFGLISTYNYLKAKEEEIEAQYHQTATALQSNIDKTEMLIEARTKMGEIGGFADRASQVDSNQKTLKEVQEQLEQLQARRQKLLDRNRTSVMGGFINSDEITKVTEQITALEESQQKLAGSTKVLSDITQEQMTAAFNAAIESGGELAEKLNAIGDINAPEAIELVERAIKDAEEQILSANAELDEVNAKLGKELVNVTQDARAQLQHLGTRFLIMAKSAGISGKALDDFNTKLAENLALLDEIEAAKKDKTGQKYLDGLRERKATQNMSTGELIKYNNRKEGLTGDDLKEADGLADSIQSGEKKGKSKHSGSKTKYDADSKNLELNIQYLRLTGQEVKANLTDIEGRYNKLIAEFQKAGNVDGINLIKKVLPLEQAKVQIDGVQAEINKLFQSQSAQEQQIQAQVQTGLISHLEGQRQLKDVYAQTVVEIEKQLPLLEKLAQMPGAQGEQARLLLEQMKLKITELKTAGNDLEKAFKDGLTQGIQSSLMGLAQGTMSLKDAIKNLALTVINAMAQIAAQQLAMQATSAVSGWFGAAVSAMGSGTVAAATGGYIRGGGTSTSDSIPARLSDGEYVVRAAAVSRYGVDFLHAINRGQLRKYNTGGLVSSPAMPSFREPGLSDSLREGRTSQQIIASPVNIQQTLAVDSAELFTAGINTVTGERALMTVIRANKQTLKQELS